MSSSSVHYTSLRDVKWSHSEKAIARKAFERALQRKFSAVIAQVKQKAARIEQPSQLWELEEFLVESRKEIDREYDYRYSVLIAVFGNLIREGQLAETDLAGLSEEKLSMIRRYVNIWNR